MIKAREVKNVVDAKRIVEERGLTHIKVGIFDIDGVMRGKYMSKSKFFSSLDKGFAFCDVVLGWDVKDQLYDNASYTGWHSGYPDAPVTIRPESCRDLPLEGNMLLFIGHFSAVAAKICPRDTLMRVVDRANDMGFDAFAALEYEFFLFNETPDSVRSKRFKDLQPMTPDNFGYSILRNSVHSDLYQQILTLAEQMDFPIESLHTETGPGVIEAALVFDDVEAAADKAALFKTFIKVLAQKNELMATFMARWSPDYPGQSGHIHLSLRHIDTAKSAFYAEHKPYQMSEIQRQFVAGQQKLMPELTAMQAQTVNSYRRLTPGIWAPTEATWGVENRTTALRVISGSESSQRVEYRLGSADANPYLSLAAALGSGLYGIEHELQLEEPVKGNAYQQKHPAELALPTTLWQAAQNLKNSAAARNLFGDDFVEHYVHSREWEEREFRKHISDWELDRYFEII